MTYDDIIYMKENSIAKITLNRPTKLNALSSRTLAELAHAITDVGQDDNMKVLYITGAGRAFSTGIDLETPQIKEGARADISRTLRLEPLAGLGRLALRLYQLEKPTIAAVNGIAAGAGLAIALGCDIRIASEKAKFSCIFVRRGLVADTGVSYLLPRVVSKAKALELMFTGDMIDSREAEHIGLVNSVVLPDNLLKVTEELAKRIAAGPSVAIELMKRMVYRSLESNNFASQLAYEAWAQSVCHQTEDAQEGRLSFLEKREAEFKGK